MYLQWCARQQLDAVAAAAREHGVTLYRDLAVGVESGGAEAWGGDDYLTSAASVLGCPRPVPCSTRRVKIGACPRSRR